MQWPLRQADTSGEIAKAARFGAFRVQSRFLGALIAGWYGPPLPFLLTRPASPTTGSQKARSHCGHQAFFCSFGTPSGSPSPLGAPVTLETSFGRCDDEEPTGDPRLERNLSHNNRARTGCHPRMATILHRRNRLYQSDPMGASTLPIAIERPEKILQWKSVKRQLHEWVIPASLAAHSSPPTGKEKRVLRFQERS